MRAKAEARGHLVAPFTINSTARRASSDSRGHTSMMVCKSRSIGRSDGGSPGFGSVVSIRRLDGSETASGARGAPDSAPLGCGIRVFPDEFAGGSSPLPPTLAFREGIGGRTCS